MYSSAPAQKLCGEVVRYMGFKERAIRPVKRLEIGGACPLIVVALECEFEVSYLDTPKRAFKTQILFAPPAAGPVIVQHSGDLQCLEAELTPWAAAALTRLPAQDWPRHPTALAELSPTAGKEIEAALARLSSFAARFQAMDKYLGVKVEGRGPTSREFRWAWNELAKFSGNVLIRDLAREVGWSRRYLITRFRDATGITPKVLARSWRFERARGLLSGSTASIAEVASACGYSDQSHLTREFRELGACSPAAFRSIRFPDLPGLPAEAAGH